MMGGIESDALNLFGWEIGLNNPFTLISGPCVIEGEEITLQIAETLKEITQKLEIPFIFKASFDKANRTSSDSFRGLGIDKGLEILQKVKNLNIPVLTDVHEYTPLNEVASVVDILQTPAMLARQTDFIRNVASQGKPMNIKKAQFMAPQDIYHVVFKAREAGAKEIMVCERGVSFGYNNLVSDMRSLQIMRRTRCPVIFDATHSVQQPGGKGSSSGGERWAVPLLARAAAAAGVAGIFMETHPHPDKAKSDGPNSWPLRSMERLLTDIKIIDSAFLSTRLDY